MIKTALLISAVAAFASTSAMAGMVPGVTLSKDNKIVSVDHGLTSFTAPPAHSPDASVIFSNIGTAYPKGLYFCCYGSTISGSSSALGSQNWVAMQFTPAAKATVSEIDAAVGWFSGTNQVTLGLYTDAGGAPGTKIKDGVASGLQTGGGCCGLAVLKTKAKLKAGTPYWVTVTTEGANNTFGFWNFNSTDQIDTVPISNNTGSGWQALGATVPAPGFAVLGK